MIWGQIRLFLGELACWEWRKRGKKTRDVSVQPLATECDVNWVESKWYMFLFHCENWLSFHGVTWLRKFIVKGMDNCSKQIIFQSSYDKCGDVCLNVYMQELYTSTWPKSKPYLYRLTEWLHNITCASCWQFSILFQVWFLQKLCRTKGNVAHSSLRQSTKIFRQGKLAKITEGRDSPWKLLLN